MKKGIFIAGLLLNSVFSQAQSEQNIWAFGEGAGLNFNIAGPASYSDNLFPGNEGCASVCNAVGNMLFYSNGLWVWDKYNHLMPALTGGVPGYTWPIATSVGYPPLMPYTGTAATQAAAICNVPAHPGKYYLFSLNSSGQLFYSEIDTTLDAGTGDLVSSKMGIYIASGLTEKMTVIKGCNNIWLVVRSQIANQYKAYEINDTGIVLTPKISSIGSLPLSWYQCGVTKFSPDGTKMAAACNYSSSNKGGIELYDFDYRTGILSNARVLDSSSTDGYYYGACFSPDNTKLYATTSSYNIGGTIYPGKVKQFNVSLGTTAAIIASNTLLYTDTATQTRDLGDLKRGIDGKIYISSRNAYSTSVFMHDIGSPNAAGLSCGFVPNAISLPTGSWLYKGLPNDVIILNEPDTVKTINYQSACFTDSLTIFALDTFGKNYLWQDNSIKQNVTVHANGIYTVGYVNNDCRYQVDVFNVNFVHVPVISPNSYSCNAQKQGIAWVKPITADTAVFTFTWVDADGSILQQHTTHTADTIKGLDTGSYTVHVHTIGGCDTNLQVKILGIPSPQASGNADSIVCKGTAINFSATTDAPVWKWYFGDGNGSGNLNPIYTYPQAGDYTAQFIVTNLEGCSDTMHIHIEVKEFILNITADKDIVNIGEQVLLQSTSDQSYIVTAWQPIALFTNQSATSQVVIMDTTRQFLVAGHSYDGCVDTATVIVSVNPIVFMPTAFSPNGDGLNDRFRPRTAGSSVFISEFNIYNRWGQLVWNGYGSAAAEGWDGKFHGVNADVGVYFYTIRAITPEEGIVDLKGDVTLVR